MSGGVRWASMRTRGGGGTPLRTVVAPCEQTSVSRGRMRPFCRGTRGWSRVASPTSAPMDGAPTRSISTQSQTTSTKRTHPIDRTHINRRTRITPLVGHPMGISNTATRHDLVMGLCIHREACGRLV